MKEHQTGEKQKKTKLQKLTRALIMMAATVFAIAVLSYVAGAFLVAKKMLEEDEVGKLAKSDSLLIYPEEIRGTVKEKCVACHDAYKDKGLMPSFYLAAQRFEALGEKGTYDEFRRTVASPLKERAKGGNYFELLSKFNGLVLRQTSKHPCSANSNIPQEQYQAFYTWMTTHEWDDSKYIAYPTLGFIANGRFSETIRARNETTLKKN